MVLWKSRYNFTQKSDIKMKYNKLVNSEYCQCQKS